MLLRAIGTILGAILGMILGSGTGIAGSFGGVAGVYVFSFLGAVIGFFATPDIRKAWSWIRQK